MSATTLTNADTFRERLAATDGILLVDFSAAWCPPCRIIEPLLVQLADENDDLTVLTVDVDETPELAAQFQVMSMPTLLFFSHGRPVRRIVGARGINVMRSELDHARVAAAMES